MRRSSTIGTATFLVALSWGIPTSAGDQSNEAAPRSVKNLKLKVSPNGRYFVDQNGKPFFYLADTCWLLFQRLDHGELDEYLKNRVAKGFTVIQAYVIRGLGKRHPDGNSSLLGEPPFLDRDATRPNEAFFKNVDYVVNRANELGLVMGLVTAKSWHVNKTPEQVFNEQNAYTFGKFLGERYQNNAVIWYPGGDSVPGKDDAVWVAMAKGLRDGCGGTQLISYHGSGQTSSATWYHKAGWLDFNTIQSGHNFRSDSYAFVSKDYALSPAKPTVDMEPAYENHPTGAGKPRVDAHKVRTQAYIAMLSGAAGHAYGSLDLFWFFKKGDGPFPRDGFMDWRTAMNYPAAGQMRAMRRLFEARPWYQLVPDQSVLASDPGKGPFRIVAARDQDGRFAIIYSPEGKPVIMKMDKVTGKTVKARWYDPREGKSTPIGEFPNTGRREFVPPTHGAQSDWALVLEDPARAFPALDSQDDSARATGQHSDFPITGPLRVSKNPRYFADASGAPLVLCGSHSWNTLQDWGLDGKIRPLDFDAFIRFLKAHGHNFTLLWYTELPRFHGLPTTDSDPPDFTVEPHPWLRMGPGLATDGRPRFDLTKFNPDYFDRVRTRVEALAKAGIYAGVYLFTGEWLLRFRCPGDGFPFSGPNNINGVDDGYRHGKSFALGSVTMTAADAITDFQDAYVEKLIDTLNDLPNVLWVVSEEAPTASTWWNDHLISLVRAYEKKKPFQHPIGYAALGEQPNDAILYDSGADWVAPSARISPARPSGTGHPAPKVIINDSDHSYYLMWNDTLQQNRNYIWENFGNGSQVLFMDPYLVHWPKWQRNLCLNPVHGIGGAPNPRYDNFRDNLGYVVRYAHKINLAEVAPRNELSSTGYCLAQTPVAGAEYLVYAPDGGSFTLDLSAMPSSRRLAVEWFNPADGKTITQSLIRAGSSSQSFTAPFHGDAVLYLVDIAGHN
jgi:hypothetical protein